jgi:hypothetical protein
MSDATAPHLLQQWETRDVVAKILDAAVKIQASFLPEMTASEWDCSREAQPALTAVAAEAFGHWQADACEVIWPELAAAWLVQQVTWAVIT